MADKRSKPGNGTGRTPTYQTAYHGGDKTNPLSSLARIIVEKFDKRRVPETTIDTIPFDQIYPDGLCRIGNTFYSRMVQFYDINYQLAQNDEKQHIFGEYCQFLNYFDETIHFQFCFINQRVDMEEYKKVITIPEQDDEFNVVRREYATYLRNQLEKGNNGIVKSKYLIFGIEARDRKQAVSRLAKIESDVINKFKLLGCKCVPVNGLERLRIMHDYLNQDSLEKFAMKSFKDVAESGLTPKNFITPTSFDFRAKDYYKIGDMFATTNYLIISAPEISDEMLADILNMEDREAIENHVFETLMDYGSISMDEKGKPLVDSDGNTLYNGDVEKGRRLDIVIGLPASGKSSAIVDTISYEQHSMLIDNDEAKRQFPEFNKGWGANTVHKESQVVERAVFKEALREGRNIVLPKVGSDADKLMTDYIAYAKDAGYKVNVHFVDLDRNKALGRMMGRFIHTGRYLSPELIDKYANERDGNKIAQAYEALKSMDLLGAKSYLRKSCA